MSDDASADLSQRILIACVADVGVTLALFAAVLVGGPGTRRLSTRTRLMNALAVALILIPLLFTLPHFYMTGRTDAECSFLHHWSGSATYLSMWLVQSFFVLRSNQIADGPVQVWFGRALLLVNFAVFVVGVIGFNLSLDTVVVDDVCIPIVDDQFAGLVGYALPFLVEAADTGRFVWLVTRTIQRTKTATDTSSLRRLVRLTCIMSLITLAVDVVMSLVAQGVIALEDPSLIPILIAAESTYSSCAVAWPMIIIAAIKLSRRGRPTTQAQQLSMGSSQPPQTTAMRALQNAPLRGTPASGPNIGGDSLTDPVSAKT